MPDIERISTQNTAPFLGWKWYISVSFLLEVANKFLNILFMYVLKRAVFFLVALFVS